MMHRAPRSGSIVPAPRTFAVSAGRPGVGATTLSVNLAISLAQQGQRVVVIDADLSRSGVAGLCGLSPPAGIADVLAGRRSIHEVLVRGPAGIQVAAGASGPECHSLCTQRSIGRFLSQVEGLGRHADVAIVDVGSTSGDLTARIWQTAERLLLVTTPEPDALMDGYAVLKSLLAGKTARPSLSVVVNRADSEQQAAGIHARMDRSCQRFLNLPAALAGWIAAANKPPIGPWILSQPAGELSQQTERIVARLLEGPSVTEAA